MATSSYAALADELLDAEARRNAAARRLEDLNRKAMEALAELRQADAEVSRVRSRLGAELGVA
jgi:flagellin-like hook-associated protein FlgL